MFWNSSSLTLVTVVTLHIVQLFRDVTPAAEQFTSQKTNKKNFPLLILNKPVAFSTQKAEVYFIEGQNYLNYVALRQALF